MQNNTVNFKVISLLEQAPGKKFVKKLVEDAFILRRQLKSFTKEHQSPLQQEIAQQMEVSQNKAQELLINVSRLVGEVTRVKFQGMEELFPEGFNEDLRSLLITIFQEYEYQWETVIQTDISQGSQLLDFDWRLDNKIASSNENEKQNVNVYLKLETYNKENNNQIKIDMFQLNEQELNTFYESLLKVKDQLSQLVES